MSRLDYSRILPLFFEGIRETDHPYVFVARAGVRDLLTAEGASDRAVMIVAECVRPLRMAFLAREKSVFNAALNALVCVQRGEGGECGGRADAERNRVRALHACVRARVCPFQTPFERCGARTEPSPGGTGACGHLPWPPPVAFISPSRHTPFHR